MSLDGHSNLANSSLMDAQAYCLPRHGQRPLKFSGVLLLSFANAHHDRHIINLYETIAQTYIVEIKISAFYTAKKDIIIAEEVSSIDAIIRYIKNYNPQYYLNSPYDMLSLIKEAGSSEGITHLKHQISAITQDYKDLISHHLHPPVARHILSARAA
jgi:hypothetical protein